MEENNNGSSDLVTAGRAIIAQDKASLIAKFQRDSQDVGSPEVQVALLTQRIERLSEHFRQHKEDVHSKRGMFKLISRRKRLLSYLHSESPERYKFTITELGLRK